jgi:hypothetical protein
MKRPFAQCLEVDVASEGESEEEALANLKERRNWTSRRRKPRLKGPNY